MLGQETLNLPQHADARGRVREPMVVAAQSDKATSTITVTPVGDTREEFARFIKAEIAKWGQAVKESGARAE